MGEATYYLKARFESAEAAQQSLPKIKEFLEQMAKAENDWQTLRGQKDRSVSELFAQLKTKYPNVFELLELAKLFEREGNGDISMNFLAGQLSSPAGDTDWEIWRNGAVIGFHGTVWHYANWEPLVQAIKRLGAQSANYVSDEYLNPYDEL